jgi:hypothetical protein
VAKAIVSPETLRARRTASGFSAFSLHPTLRLVLQETVVDADRLRFTPKLVCAEFLRTTGIH